MRERAPADSPERWNAWSKGPHKLRAFRRILFGSCLWAGPRVQSQVGDYGFLGSNGQATRSRPLHMPSSAIFCQDDDGDDGCAPRRGRGERNCLKRQIARMLSGRDSNYYYHLPATGIALPRMIIRGDAPRQGSFRFSGPYDKGSFSSPHLNAISRLPAMRNSL